MKFKLNESENTTMFKKGDIVVPKKEWLNPGETPRPMIVVDAWDSTEGERITVYSVEEAEQMANGTLKGFPLSREDSFAKYYELVK